MARKPNPAFMRPLQVSSELGAIVGGGSMPRTMIVKKLWVYIKKNGLQDKKEKTMINNDATMRAVFGKSQMSMFEMNKLLKKHVK